MAYPIKKNNGTDWCVIQQLQLTCTGETGTQTIALTATALIAADCIVANLVTLRSTCVALIYVWKHYQNVPYEYAYGHMNMHMDI